MLVELEAQTLCSKVAINLFTPNRPGEKSYSNVFVHTTLFLYTQQCFCTNESHRQLTYHSRSLIRFFTWSSLNSQRFKVSTCGQ